VYEDPARFRSPQEAKKRRKTKKGGEALPTEYIFTAIRTQCYGWNLLKMELGRVVLRRLSLRNFWNPGPHMKYYVKRDFMDAVQALNMRHQGNFHLERKSFSFSF
jgi:hypothetical protein